MKLHTSIRQFLRQGPKRGPRVLVGDIETFPMEGYFFRMFKPVIGRDQVTQDVTLMSYAFKWFEQDDIIYNDMSKAKTREERRNDVKLATDMAQILDSVDFVVAHNGIKFDLRQIRSRCVQNEVAPFSPVKVIDTFQLNKSTFDFSSQALGFISPKFTTESKSDHAQFPGFKLWRECLEGNKEAWAECKDYNITDVTSLEQTYLRLRGWYAGHPNLGAFIDFIGGEPVCPNCRSTDVTHLAKPYRTQVGVYDAYRCDNCGAHSRGRVLIRSRAERSHILMN